MYPTYLIHFNQNHSSKNGQFTSGDGDGDGVRNDHANARKNPDNRSSLSRNLGSSKGKSLSIKGKSFAGDFNDATVTTDSSTGVMSFGWRGGSADPETEEEKRKRKKLKYDALLASVDPSLVDGWIDDKVNADYKMWDLAFDRTDIVKDEYGRDVIYIDEEGHRRAKTRSHRNPALNENNHKEKKDSNRARSSGFGSRYH